MAWLLLNHNAEYFNILKSDYATDCCDVLQNY